GAVKVGVVRKGGLGPNCQLVNVNGTTRLTAPGGGSAVASGGLLALAGTNIGVSSTGWFSIVPEVGAQLGWQVTDNLKIQVGYSFLYVNSVVRPGDQINRNVNPAFIPTSGVFGLSASPAEPGPLFRKTDYLAHGINAGVPLRY